MKIIRCICQKSFLVIPDQKAMSRAIRDHVEKDHAPEEKEEIENDLLLMKIVYEGTAELVMHPVRFKILKHINGAHRKQFVEEIAKAINEHPRLVSHHLDVLQDLGLIECTYEVTKAKGSKRRRVAVRFCTATQKLAEVFKDVAKAAEVLAEAK